MLTAYNTCQIEPSQRLDYWTESICKTYLAVECRQDPGVPVFGQLSVGRINDLEISESISPAMVYHRNRELLRRHHEEHFQLILISKGTGRLEQRGIQASLAPGDIALHSASSPFCMSYPSGSQSLVLKIPRTRLIESSTYTEDSMSLTLKACTPMGSVLGNLIRECLTLEQHTQVVQAARLADGIIDIASVAFDKASAQSIIGNSALEQVKRVIRKSLADPEISFSDIAAQSNISIRTLNRLFAAEGTTANRWMWLQRLEESYASLSQRRVRQVSEAALNCGFNDLSHFSKLFKKTYGVTPLKVLRSNLS